MSEQGDRKRMIRGIICALLGGICWGFSGTCAQMLMDTYGVPVFWITCVRMLGAAVVFIGVVMVRDRSAFFAVLRDWRSLLAIFGFAILGVLLTQVSYLTAISYTNAGTGTVLERTGLVLIMLFVCVRARRLPRVKEILGLLLAFGGTCVIAFQGDFSRLAIAPEGLFWGLVSGLALAFYTLIPVKVLEKWGAMIVTGLAMFSGGTVATAFMQPWTIPVELNGGIVAGMVAIIVIGTLGAYMFYLQGVTDAGPVKASLVGCIEPVSATFLACVWLGTQITGWDLLGCAMIIGMMFLVTQKDGPSRNEAADRSDASGIEETAGVSSAETGREGAPPLFRGRASDLGYLRTRKANPGDTDALRAVLADGRAYLSSIGVWQGIKRYPSARRLRRSIDEGDCYVVEDSSGAIVGMFNLTIGGDTWYDEVYDGAWLTDSTSAEARYAVLRWMTVRAEARKRGVGMFILGEADRLSREMGKASVRADTYEGNVPTQRALLKHGYKLCGSIRAHATLEGPKRRTCFEKEL